ncbi:MAG: prepilin-type N-terminal cleavage/methylation domain-containing protein [Candidatus Metalachnospira sp.]|nr:prepilin-type N-terminal cleavage/methylation domain-containing protein [Candidatus Metalachnospira sp.]
MLKNNKRGFSLLEMLIVVAIIVILLAMVISAALPAISKTEAAVCASNRKSAVTVLQSDIILNELDPKDIQKALDDLNIKCPSEGVYHANYDEETQTVAVECSKHTQTITQSVLTEFIQMCQDYVDYSSYKSSDKLRKAMYQQLGNKWNTIGFEDNDAEYYIQPYWNVNSDEMYVFASTQSNTDGNWYTGYIYNADTATWYHGPSFSFVGKNMTCWDDVWDTMQSKGWKPVEVEFEK